MSPELPPGRTLDSLKKEAKRWLKALRANVDDARARLERALPNAPHDSGTAPRAACTGARARISRLERPEETSSPDGASGETRADRSRRLVPRVCLPGSSHPRRTSPRHAPCIPRFAFSHTIRRSRTTISTRRSSAAILAGVESALARDATLATEKRAAVGADRTKPRDDDGNLRDDLGPKRWEPLLFLAFTRLPLQQANDNAVAIARALLDHGADPNVFFMAGDSRYTPLVGVIGEGEEDASAAPAARHARQAAVGSRRRTVRHPGHLQHPLQRQDSLVPEGDL